MLEFETQNIVATMQGETMSKGLLTTNSRIAKQDLSIPCLELIAGHMVANSLCNIHESLASYVSPVLG